MFPGDERPSGPVPVARAVAVLAGGDPTELVWRNSLGGLTFHVAAGTLTDRYIKWVRVGTPEIDLQAEAERLTWIAGRIPAPEVLASGCDDEGSWLVTKAIPARSAVDLRWRAEPDTAVKAIASGLRSLHNSLPVTGCPFRWDSQARLDHVRERLEAGEGPEAWFPEHRQLTVDDAFARLHAPPSLDQLVVCHGDPCAPNTLLDDDGRFAAVVDLGKLGIADRWADLAVAAWSTEWNYGPGLDGLLYDTYGVDPDPERIDYYRLLWDLA